MMRAPSRTPAAALLLIAFAFTIGALPGTLLAKGDAAQGRGKATTCEACHGKNGMSIDPNYPNLAGQHSSYLIKALSDYRSGRRTNAIMASFASGLKNQDIEDLAAWYSSLPGLQDLSLE